MTAPAAVAGLRMTEAQLQDAIVQAARSLGYLVYHCRDSRTNEPGFPDLVIVGHGRLYVFECKSAKGKLRETSETKRGRVLPGQWEWLAQFADAGAGIAVVRPNDLDGILAELKDGYERVRTP